MVPVRFQVLGDSDDNSNYNSNHRLSNTSSYRLSALCKAYNFILATLGGELPSSDEIR